MNSDRQPLHFRNDKYLQGLRSASLWNNLAAQALSAFNMPFAARYGRSFKYKAPILLAV